MAKSDLTKNIERYLLNSYEPNELGGQKINKMRKSFIANEVPVECGTVTAGLVDCIRIDETLINKGSVRICSKKKGNICYENSFKCPRGEEVLYCDKKDCIANYNAVSYENGICITAIEIKITKADFLSKHGHNFCGNCNYYVVPYYLYNEIKDLVPEDVGILIFYDGTQNEGKKKKEKNYSFNYYGVKKKKDCIYKPLTDEDQKWLVLSVMKRLQKMKDEEKEELKKKIKELQNCGGCNKSMWE